MEFWLLRDSDWDFAFWLRAELRFYFLFAFFVVVVCLLGVWKPGQPILWERRSWTGAIPLAKSSVPGFERLHAALGVSGNWGRVNYWQWAVGEHSVLISFIIEEAASLVGNFSGKWGRRKFNGVIVNEKTKLEVWVYLIQGCSVK